MTSATVVSGCICCIFEIQIDELFMRYSTSNNGILLESGLEVLKIIENGKFDRSAHIVSKNK